MIPNLAGDGLLYFKYTLKQRGLGHVNDDCGYANGANSQRWVFVWVNRYYLWHETINDSPAVPTITVSKDTEVFVNLE